jgi:hypothetical protein
LAIFQYLCFFFLCFSIAGNGTERNFDDDVFAVAAGHVILVAAFSVFGEYILIISQVEECPEIFISFQDDVSASSAIAAIRSCHRVELGAQKMFASCAAVSRAGEDPDLVYKV